eukprot:2606665-Amphidinium_carterae.1
MIKEMNNLKELNVFTDVNIKSMSAAEVPKTIDSCWVISERPGSDGSMDFKWDWLPEDSVNHHPPHRLSK